MVPNHPIPVDVTDPTTLHIITLSVEPVTDRMRRDPLARILPLARHALIATDHEGHRHILATDADGLGNLIHLGRSVACAEHAGFAEPASTCRYCGSPTARDVDYCPPTRGRDCRDLDGRREEAWRDFPRDTAGATAHALGLVA